MKRVRTRIASITSDIFLPPPAWPLESVSRPLCAHMWHVEKCDSPTDASPHFSPVCSQGRDRGSGCVGDTLVPGRRNRNGDPRAIEPVWMGWKKAAGGVARRDPDAPAARSIFNLYARSPRGGLSTAAAAGTGESGSRRPVETERGRGSSPPATPIPCEPSPESGLRS